MLPQILGMLAWHDCMVVFFFVRGVLYVFTVYKPNHTYTLLTHRFVSPVVIKKRSSGPKKL